MEPVMPQQSNPGTLQSWWEELSLPEKELYHVSENGELILKPLLQNKERIIATLSPDNAHLTLKALKDRFTEVEARMKELEQEWESTADKLKLSSKVERLKEYLLHTNAVGDIGTLLHKAANWEQIIADLSEENYKAKQKLVEEAEALITNDNWKDATKAYRDIAEKWKTIGYVTKARNEDLWNRLEEARNKFFERKRSNQEDHEKEMLQNMDMKMELVEKAEALTESTEWKETTEIFRQLMDQWKTIGRTSTDKNESLWNRFIAAKNKFYDRKRVHFETIQQEQEANYAAKKIIVEKAEALKNSTEYNKTTQAFAELTEEWKNIGRVPIEKADELWNLFNAAKEVFFQAKRLHTETIRVSLDDNYAQKTALLKRAESLKNSTNWREVSIEMNELMDEWKKIGPAPREHNNVIWEQFLAARKLFFKRKDENRDQRKKQAEKHMVQRTEQIRNSVTKIQEEIREEEDNLEDFRNSLQNITPGRKENELRAHLENLISQGEARLARRLEKLEEAKKEVEKLDTKSEPKADVAE